MLITSFFQFFYRFESFQNFENGSGEEDLRNKDEARAFCLTALPPHLPGKSVNNTMTMILQSVSVGSPCCSFRD